ncbi:MAG: hypothetical protein ABF883_10455, partial [Acetobacter sp.]|uniref:hypothetical protein n=1 Tax=Acetobacter sp. TaxID=440 RepID=UPI0039E91ED7
FWVAAAVAGVVVVRRAMVAVVAAVVTRRVVLVVDVRGLRTGPVLTPERVEVQKKPLRFP